MRSVPSMGERREIDQPLFLFLEAVGEAHFLSGAQCFPVYVTVPEMGLFVATSRVVCEGSPGCWVGIIT